VSSPADRVLGRDVEFRPERPGDEAQVRAVVGDAFADHAIVPTLVDTFRTSPDWIDGLSFVAETDDRIVGHILFTRSVLDAPERIVDVLVLSPVSVAQEFQGRGIGSAMLRFGFEQLQSGPWPLVFLEGDPRLYGRFGFVSGKSLGFRRPSLRIPEPGFQVLTLPGYEPWMTGTLVYSRVFWDLDCVGLRGERLAEFGGT
jgi:putative acetyltransferase